MPNCLICDAEVGPPIYVSRQHASLTTMLSVCDGTTEVHFCDDCGHLQTREIVEIEDYYEHVYSILADSDEEDQLYKVIAGRKVFQTEHRVKTLLEKVELPDRARVLDVGCAKGLILNEICQHRKSVRPYYFEMSERYVRFWEKQAKPDQWAIGKFPAHWKNQFDVVTSFYVLEHVDHPLTAIRQQAELLTTGGTLYFVVPNVFANTADFVVADHLQHYSENSLIRLLERCGLEVSHIDDAVHESAFVVAARKVAKPKPFRQPQRSIASLKQQVLEMSRFWTNLSGRIRAFEQAHANGDLACIYGAGFYGNFIASCLQNPDNIACFVDQNEFIRRKPMQGKPVVAPEEVDPQVKRIYVGLNPTRAREIIGCIPSWTDRQFDFFYV